MVDKNGKHNVIFYLLPTPLPPKKQHSDWPFNNSAVWVLGNGRSFSEDVSSNSCSLPLISLRQNHAQTMQSRDRFYLYFSGKRWTGFLFCKYAMAIWNVQMWIKNQSKVVKLLLIQNWFWNWKGGKKQAENQRNKSISLLFLGDDLANAAFIHNNGWYFCVAFMAVCHEQSFILAVDSLELPKLLFFFQLYINYWSNSSFIFCFSGGN